MDPFPLPQGKEAPIPCPPILSSDFATFSRVALGCQKMARKFGDKQNSDSTLTATDCMKLVSLLLNAGNLMAQAVKDSLPKDQQCPPTTSSTEPTT